MARPASEAARQLAEARAGDPAALGQALEACRRYLLAIARQEIDADLQAKGGASDLVQETFLKAHRHFELFAGSSEVELKAWLRRLLLNNLVDFQRAYRDTGKRCAAREQALESGNSSQTQGNLPAAETPSPSVEAITNEETQAIQRAVAQLPEDYRRIILLRYQEEKSFEEIGRLMELTPNAARKLWLRALKLLRQETDELA